MASDDVGGLPVGIWPARSDQLAVDSLRARGGEWTAGLKRAADGTTTVWRAKGGSEPMSMPIDGSINPRAVAVNDKGDLLTIGQSGQVLVGQAGREAGNKSARPP